MRLPLILLLFVALGCVQPQRTPATLFALGTEQPPEFPGGDWRRRLYYSNSHSTVTDYGHAFASAPATGSGKAAFLFGSTSEHEHLNETRYGRLTHSIVGEGSYSRRFLFSDDDAVRRYGHDVAWRALELQEQPWRMFVSSAAAVHAVEPSQPYAPVFPQFFYETAWSTSRVRPMRPPAELSFGAALAALRSLDGDAIDDVAAGEPGKFGGRIEILAGSDGSSFAEILNAPANPLSRTYPYGYRLGSSLANAGDIDGDGFDDLLAGARGMHPDDYSPPFYGEELAGKAHLFSGTSQSELFAWQIGTQSYDYRVFGGGHLDADGVPDFVISVGQYQPDDPSGEVPLTSGVFAFSGATFEELWRYTVPLVSPNENAHVGSDVAFGEDFDGDGVPEVLVGAAGLSTNPGLERGAVQLLSGADGQLLRTLWPTFNGSGFAQQVAWLGHPEGAAEPRIAVSAPDHQVYGSDGGPGRIHIYSFEPFIQASATTLSASGSETVALEFSFPYEPGQNTPTRKYGLLVSGSGIAPASNFEGVWVPLASPDAIYDQMAAGNVPALIDNVIESVVGPLTQHGEGSTELHSHASLAGQVGNTFFIAAVEFQDNVAVRSSRPVAVEIVP